MIPWYMEDDRFKPGTVADIGGSIRLKLQQMERHTAQGWQLCNEYRLYLFVRTRKEDGAGDELKRGVKVAVFKKCRSLQEAQGCAGKWFDRWRDGLFIY